jgi:hypothetical protein
VQKELDLEISLRIFELIIFDPIYGYRSNGTAFMIFGSCLIYLNSYPKFPFQQFVCSKKQEAF